MPLDPSLNLNLGLPVTYDGPVLTAVRQLFKLPSFIFSISLERPLFFTWKMVPVSIRCGLAKYGWLGYLAVHKKLIGKATALHPSLSHEYAALTTLMWSARLIPMSLYRMRFGLNQIECNFPPDKSLRKEKISERNGAVRGIYIHSQQNVSDEKDRKVLFWLYGGAFLAGDCVGNLGLAESVAKAVNCDVYLAEYTLFPEGSIIDASKDVEECYTWLVEESGRVKSGDQVSVLGISSGGGVALSLIQKMAAKPKKYQPRAAVLISPWVHYDWENLYPSLSENAAHDLIVTQQVFNYVLPCSPQMAGGVENRTTCSPLGKSCEGVCPTLIVCSEHEATTDEDLALFDKMKKQGVDVTLHSYKYLCHVWCLVPFLPEAQETMGKVHVWMKERVWA
ncbi:hypothetical protein TeGR_g12360 [Tetraparma gracilis]|uniref:Alpha/beta hydrolase fold-3 domain-containing protein n=1 Tax=Tetraparma gracilis TaxID=2962635 RepID=A0ABQ6N2Y0_9STRA|nr:hypothetical protein TeGR_g12360 [Tetraparma gracilis]